MIDNPVLRGFSPDPSIVRDGDDYYIATSTFEWFPGVRLHHSRDLVHWREIGGALTRADQLDLRGVPDSGGVWAPSLSRADGLFWLVTTNVRTWGVGRPFKDLGITLTTAPRIEGPWSTPVTLNSIGFDPSLFHDDDGRKWLVNLEWDFRKAGLRRFAGIVLQEYDPVLRRLVGPMRKILEKDVLIEGPNLYKRDGWYYLLLAEGGTGWNHGISLARSRSLFGPYETDPQRALLSTRDAPGHPLQKAGHGEWVETPAGENYLVHLASRPLTVAVDGKAPERRCMLGRETCLQKVRWSADGWLRLDPESRWGETGAPWHPADRVPAPAGVELQPWAVHDERDDFTPETLAPEWSSLRVPVSEAWASLAARPGWLRLRGRESLHSLFNQSLLAKPLRSVRCRAETCIEFFPTHFTQAAGLVCYYDTRTHFYLRITHDEQLGRVLGVASTDDGTYREPDERIPIEGWPRCFLRADIEESGLRFSASPDGERWQTVGGEFDASKLSDDYGSVLHFTGAMAGLCAQDLGGEGAFADFDYFTLTDLENSR